MLLRPVRQVHPTRAVDDEPVTILLLNAYGMGGATRSVFTMAEQLAKTREVEILSVVRAREEPAFPFPAGVRVTVLDDRWQRRQPLARLIAKTPSVLMHPHDRAYSWFSLRTDVLLWRRIRSLRGGFLIGTRPALNILAGRIARRAVVLIAQEHINVGSYTGDLPREVAAAYGGFDCVVLLTERDRPHHVASLQGRSTEVEVIPNAVSRLPGVPLAAAQRRRVVVAAGRLSPQKGYDLLIDAFRPVASEHPDWRLEIHGDGEAAQAQALSARIAEAGLTEQVRLAGPTKAIGEVLATSAIFALSSRWEGMPLVVLEAMSKAMAVVAFDCPTGPRELIRDGVDGLLVPPEDVDALARSLRRLIEDEQLRGRLAGAAMEAAAAYDPDAIGARWRDLLDRLQRRAPVNAR